jgi:hypothetical protein
MASSSSRPNGGAAPAFIAEPAIGGSRAEIGEITSRVSISRLLSDRIAVALSHQVYKTD